MTDLITKVPDKRDLSIAEKIYASGIDMLGYTEVPFVNGNLIGYKGEMYRILQKNVAV